jgi:osmotically-inducible protein OsmY
MDRTSSGALNTNRPANDALLVRLVRGALGRRWRGPSGINVSSCSFVVTLHGTVGNAEEREVVRAVPGVEDVMNRPRVA